MTTEQWKPIPGWEDLYQVSSLGQVRSLDRIDARGLERPGRMLKLATTRGGYAQVGLCRDGKNRSIRVHRLVLLAFVGPPAQGQEGCHGDGNPANNTLGNLRWDSPSANTLDRLRHGTDANARKTCCPFGHEYDEANTYVYLRSSSGARYCRTCNRNRKRAYRARRAYNIDTKERA